MSLNTGTDFVFLLAFHVKEAILNIFVYGKCMIKDLSDFI